VTLDEFESEVERHFGFLRELGFSREIRDYGREYSISFTKPGVAVVVIYELGTTPYVILEDRSIQQETDWWFRRSFGLHELLQEATSPTSSIPETLSDQADALHRFGADVLNADFRVLHERQRRLGLAVERNRV
jgi:hypothetical protein